MVLVCLELLVCLGWELFEYLIADQIYGDEEMHDDVRKLCMDYIVSGPLNIRSPILGGQPRSLFPICNRRFRNLFNTKKRTRRPWKPC